jgi:hypothetical protein
MNDFRHRLGTVNFMGDPGAASGEPLQALSLPMMIFIHRTMVCVALIIALLGRSRRWDWAAVALAAAAYALRLVTQMVQ